MAFVLGLRGRRRQHQEQGTQTQKTSRDHRRLTLKYSAGPGLHPPSNGISVCVMHHRQKRSNGRIAVTSLAWPASPGARRGLFFGLIGLEQLAAAAP
jgi:hypothetical protein